MTDSAESLARRFLDACADIEATLKQRYNLRARGLGEVVREVEHRDPVIGPNRTALRVFIELRNVLSHTAYREGAPVAAPLATTVSAIERLRDEIARPRPALAFAHSDVLTAQHDAPLPHLLQEMATKDISQVPVYNADGVVQLLTTNAIARWVAAHLDEDGSVLIEAGTTASALTFAEPHERVKLVKRTSTAAAALAQLTRKDPPTAILITENGRGGEQPLGILASTDVARLFEALTVEAY